MGHEIILAVKCIVLAITSGQNDVVCCVTERPTYLDSLAAAVLALRDPEGPLWMRSPS